MKNNSLKQYIESTETEQGKVAEINLQISTIINEDGEVIIKLYRVRVL